MSIHSATVRPGVAELFHAAQHAALWIRACAWCGEIWEINLADEQHPAAVSHGICRQCEAGLRAGR